MINDTNVHPAPGYILAEQIKAVKSTGGIILPSEPGRRDEEHDRVIVLEDGRLAAYAAAEELQLAPGTRILVVGGKGMDTLVPGRVLLFIKADELIGWIAAEPALHISDN